MGVFRIFPSGAHAFLGLHLSSLVSASVGLQVLRLTANLFKLMSLTILFCLQFTFQRLSYSKLAG